MCARSTIGRLNRTGMEACCNGRLEDAEATLLSALRQAQREGVRCFEAKISNNLGIVYELKGCPGEARECYLKALHIFREKGIIAHPASLRVVDRLARLSGGV